MVGDNRPVHYPTLINDFKCPVLVRCLCSTQGKQRNIKRQRDLCRRRGSLQDGPIIPKNVWAKFLMTQVICHESWSPEKVIVYYLGFCMFSYVFLWFSMFGESSQKSARLVSVMKFKHWDIELVVVLKMQAWHMARIESEVQLEMAQGGPLLVINWVKSPISGLLSG